MYDYREAPPSERTMERTRQTRKPSLKKGGKGVKSTPVLRKSPRKKELASQLITINYEKQ
jgi:hypothetical protein